MRKVSVGQHFRTIHNVDDGFLETSCMFVPSKVTQEES